MSSPVNLNVGDLNDDDAEVIDTMLQQNPNPPAPPLDRINVPFIGKSKPETRLLTGFITIDPTWPAQLLAPSDPNRKHFRIRCDGATATDGIAIASDPAQLNVINGTVRAGRIYNGEKESFDDLTGPIYARIFGAGVDAAATTAVNVSWWAITE